MSQNTITVRGNLTSEPELRYTQNGTAVANFTIASTERIFDSTANEWKDGETTFLRSTLWRDDAENLAHSATKGTRVIATGRIQQKDYETKEGEKRSSIEFEIEEIGVSVKYATALVSRVNKKDSAAEAETPTEKQSAK